MHLFKSRMPKECKRIFIPNLPEDYSEKDVRQDFFKYGDITSVEIKYRKDSNARNFSHKYAFVNIDTTHQLLQQCFDEYPRKMLNGHHITIQLAKESFLERLRKEREEAEAQKQPARKFDIIVAPDDLNTQSKANINRFAVQDEGMEEVPTRKNKGDNASKLEMTVANTVDSSIGNSDNDECTHNIESSKNNVEDDIVSDLVVRSNKHKKPSSKIEGVGLKPIHVQTHEVKRKSKDPYREKADQKRLNSMYKAKQGYMLQKSMIKNALLNIDESKKNKIIFNDDPVHRRCLDGQEKVEDVAGATKKLTLFNEDDHEDNEHSFQLREEYEGKKGRKLFEMQSRYNQDARFKLDARFAEDSGNDSENGEENLQEDNHDERELHRKVLTKVLSQPIEQPTSSQQKTRKTMLRFDPSQPEHSKYEIKINEKHSKRKKQKELDQKEDRGEEEKLPEVSSETFYKVDGNVQFQESGKQEVFSLLQAFGRTNDSDDNPTRNDADDNLGKTKKVSKTLVQGATAFKYDSSEDERDNNAYNIGKSDEIAPQPQNCDNAMEPESSKFNKPSGLGQFVGERFFFIKDDYRFQEGIDFVKRMWGAEDDGQFPKVRQDLKKIVKRKVNTINKKKQQFRKKIGGHKHKTNNRVRN